MVSRVFCKRECGNLVRSRYVIRLIRINCLDSLSNTMYTLSLWHEFSPLYPNIWVFCFIDLCANRMGKCLKARPLSVSMHLWMYSLHCFHLFRCRALPYFWFSWVHGTVVFDFSCVYVCLVLTVTSTATYIQTDSQTHSLYVCWWEICFFLSVVSFFER